MNVFIIVVSCIVFLLLLFCLFFLCGKLKFKVVVENKITIVYLLNLKVYDSISKKTKLHNKTLNEKNFESKYKKIKNTINFFRKLLDDKHDDFIYILKYINKTLDIRIINLSLDYGFGNAAITGITGGIIWGLISNVCCIIHKYADNIKEIMNIAVKPHYTEQVFEYKIDIVFYVRVKDLIKVLKHIKRFKNTLEGGI